ncbi:benzil reductase ((S)-benzoin forming) [Pelagirhabdus alkalitolerans]|uniref:Benzil reductase ((S)-benzoin forming) n=1 Tax=Pelagirhabdus alkalitolerans TaxID=1612202 RepID=A0A1G6N690_9BACI|nr:(S)-benzoin forming benzil reductase [Pelagirhabdus alkalitolerans]SDC62944.1 benzil reductase ((S)-benzoin forming) [Pelagirhabdus alkalitolerans]
MEYAIITGTSKGLGEAISEAFLRLGVSVIGIARQTNKRLQTLANDLEADYQHVNCNLADSDQIDRTFDKIIDQVFKSDTERVYLINNAATVSPTDVAHQHTIEAIEAHMQVNLIAPMITTSLVLKAGYKKGIPVRVSNVTSGAANRSTYGWSAYGASKAGLDRYTETVAFEASELEADHKITLFDPSVMDTNMQSVIRSKSKDAFKDVEQFKALKETEQLRDTKTVAGVCVSVLMDDNIENGKTYSIKDYV